MFGKTGQRIYCLYRMLWNAAQTPSRTEAFISLARPCSWLLWAHSFSPRIALSGSYLAKVTSPSQRLLASSYCSLHPSSLKDDPAPACSLGWISVSLAAVLQFSFRQYLLRSMRLSYKKTNNSDLSRLQIFKNQRNQWGVVWRKFFLLLSPGEFVLMLTSSLCRPSFSLSLLKTGIRWKSLDCII